ncbi:hypothetical protein [Candidatus Enterovibrio escicola]|uniref:hypothetical protein n=1 Tax=Candidatus Enterovibrio escicola TaxID=1927127 RepID=UPI000BE3A8D4|nr:hypothetical protein [Candidatus Enterovibrio escacola]
MFWIRITIMLGAESGVDLSEELCIVFELFSNDALLLDSRKSKAKINDVLKSKILLAEKQQYFTII